MPVLRALRRSEWVMLAYLGYTSILALSHPLPGGGRSVILSANAVFAAGLLFGAWAASLRTSPFLSIARDWFALGVLIFGYREIGWFAPEAHLRLYEQGWVYWDRLLLNDWGLRAAIESLGPVIPSLLEICYTLVYTIAPASLALLYVYGHQDRSDRLLAPILLATFATYALYPYFPSEPPWTVFPGQDAPQVQTFFHRFNGGMVGGYGIRISVFPSAHVSTAVASALALMRTIPEHRNIGRAALAAATLIAVATVYGRYHYAVDGLAGAAVAVLATALSAAWERSSPKNQPGPTVSQQPAA